MAGAKTTVVLPQEIFDQEGEPNTDAKVDTDGD